MEATAAGITGSRMLGVKSTREPQVQLHCIAALLPFISFFQGCHSMHNSFGNLWITRNNDTAIKKLH